MSASILANIYRRVQTSQAESTVLQILSHRTNVQGLNARISYEALAKATNFSERWVKEIVRRLEAKYLLRVYRQWLAPHKNAINRYDIIRPWLRELSYREAYHRKQATAHSSSEGFIHPYPNAREKKESEGFCTHEECIAIGLTPGSIAYRSARGLPLGENPDIPAG